VGRVAGKIFAVVSVALFLATASSGAEAPRAAKGRPPGRKGDLRRLEEVKITGSPEHPEVLFFLPRARFRLLPMGPDRDWKEEMLRNDREKGAPPK
jgi:hypothetical protein